MSAASLLAESLRHRETIDLARQRLNAAAHVAQHYRAISLPALAAAAARVAERRRARRRNDAVQQTGHSD